MTTGHTVATGGRGSPWTGWTSAAATTTGAMGRLCRKNVLERLVELTRLLVHFKGLKVFRIGRLFMLICFIVRVTLGILLYSPPFLW